MLSQYFYNKKFVTIIFLYFYGKYFLEFFIISLKDIKNTNKTPTEIICLTTHVKCCPNTKYIRQRSNVKFFSVTKDTIKI